MIQLSKLVLFLNEYLAINNYEDICINGLQIEGKSEINKVITGVTASYELFQKAVKKKADVIIVHHGILLSNRSYSIRGHLKNKISLLLSHNISLLTYHLPLDANQELGNNIKLIQLLSLKPLCQFGQYKNKKIGFIGYSPIKKNLSYFIDQLKSNLENKMDLIIYPFGKKNIQKVAILSGAGASFLEEAIEHDCDLMISGEAKESTLHLAKEEKINFLSIGHYNSEKLGILALGNLIQNKFKISHEFIDIPNNI